MTLTQRPHSDTSSPTAMADVRDDEDDAGIGLGDVFPEPERPPTPPPTFSTFARKNLSELKIRLVGAHPLWGHHLWNAARSFATYLDDNAAELCIGKRVLELGAGGALPGLVAALNGAEKVMLTDYPDAALIRNIEANVKENISEDRRPRVMVTGYIWGTSVQPLLQTLSSSGDTKFDLILMSDLIFNHSQHIALLKTMGEALGAARGREQMPCCLVFYTHHRPHLAHRDMEFFRLAGEDGWQCEEIVTERLGAMFPEDSGDVEIRSTVHGWRLWKTV